MHPIRPGSSRGASEAGPEEELMLSLTKCYAGLLVLAALVPSVQAQEVRASITGEITDSTGAPVSGASIRVTNLASRTVTTAKSNESGSYATPFLAPGPYELTVEASGFKRFVRQNITLQTQDKLRLD